MKQDVPHESEKRYISLGIGYAIAEGIIGREAAQRNLHYLLPWTLLTLFVFAIACLIPWFAIYGSVSFQILSVVVTSSGLISWSFQKQKAALSDVDSVVWQRETPQDRSLPGR